MLTIVFLSSLTANMQRRVRHFFITLISLGMSFKPLKMEGWPYLRITFMELAVNKSTLPFVPMLVHLRKDASSVLDGRVWRVSHQQIISNRSDRYNFPVQWMQTSIAQRCQQPRSPTDHPSLNCGKRKRCTPEPWNTWWLMV